MNGMGFFSSFSFFYFGRLSMTSFGYGIGTRMTQMTQIKRNFYGYRSAINGFERISFGGGEFLILLVFLIF
jgi:hypothetical protein